MAGGTPAKPAKPKVKARRGKRRVTTVKPRSQSVTFVDPQPPGRYNLGFHADYPRTDANGNVVGRDEYRWQVARAFLSFYHEKFPAMLRTDAPWTGKTPSSRTSCACQVIDEVDSLADLVGKIHHFAAHTMQGKEGKFGTISLVAHGGPSSVALPIAKGYPRVTFEELTRGLEYCEAVWRGKELNWVPADWEQLKDGYGHLKVEFDKLHQNVRHWFDEKTLIRFWACNLGRLEKTLRFFGKLLVRNGHVTLEGPKDVMYSASRGDSRFSGKPAHVYNWMKRAKWLHPDIDSEIQSDKSLKRFGKSDLSDAIDEFGTRIVQPVDPNVAGRYPWVPALAVKPGRALVYPGDWRKFRARWRTVTL